MHRLPVALMIRKHNDIFNTAINEKMVILNTGKKNVKGAKTRLMLQEGKETRRRVGSTPPCPQCHSEGEKQGGVWTPCRLILDAMVKKGNKAECGFHTASSSMTQESGETRRRVGSTPPRLRCPRKGGKRGGVWTPHCLIFDAPEKGGNEAAYGLTQPRLRCSRKEGKRGSVWTPHCLVFNAAGRSGNEAACGLHTTWSSMPREG